MILAISMVASVNGGKLELKSGDKHFYRVRRGDGGPVI